MITRSTSKNNRRPWLGALSLTRPPRLAPLLLLLSLLGTERGLTQEHKPHAQENQSASSRHSWDSISSIEISDDTGATVQLEGGRLFLITPRADTVLDIVTYTRDRLVPSASLAHAALGFDRTEILFTREKVAEPSETHRYLPVGLLLLKNIKLEVFFSMSVGSSLPGAPWPSNVKQQEEGISIPNRYTGSGYIFLFVIDSSDFGDVFSVTVDGVINAVVVSNIVRQPVRFVEE